MKRLRQRHAASVEAMRRKCLLLSVAARADGALGTSGGVGPGRDHVSSVHGVGAGARTV